MVVTRRGAAGVSVAGHVTKELILALVHVPVPLQHTVDEVAISADWDQLLKFKDATRTCTSVQGFFFFFCAKYIT